MSFLSNLQKLFKSDLARDVASIYPPAALAIKVSDVVEKARAGDEQAIEKVRTIKQLADAGDPKAKSAVVMMSKVSNCASAKAAKATDFYGRGVVVGHDPYDFVGVGAARTGYSFNYTTNSWYRTPRGQPDIPGPCGPGTPMQSTDHRGAGGSNVTATPGGRTRTTVLTPAQRLALHAKGRGQMGSEQLRSHFADQAMNSFAAKQAFAQAAATRQAQRKAFVRDLSPVESDPDTFQDHKQTAWDLGVSDKVPPALQEQFGVDENGNPIPGWQDPANPYGTDPYGGYGGGYGGDPYGGMMYGDVDPFYGQLASPYGAYGGLPPFFDPYGGYMTDPVQQANRQQYDPATDRFYSDCVQQVYDPETCTFAPKQGYNPYLDGFDPYGFNVSGWAYNRPFRPVSQHIANANKSPGIALATRELYSRGLGNPKTTRTSVVRQGLAGYPGITQVFDAATQLLG